MVAIKKIRPISELHNDSASVEADVGEGSVSLKKNWYGGFVLMANEGYECLSDPLERLFDETDEYCLSHLERENGEAMFKRIRYRRHALRNASPIHLQRAKLENPDMGERGRPIDGAEIAGQSELYFMELLK